MPRTLHIHEPCAEPWDTMAGTDARKHCARCDKHVVALAEMTAEQAQALLESAPPRSLCVRVEHDDEGVVIFKDERSRAPLGSAARRLAVGASLLVAACTRTEPAPTAAPDESKVAVAEPHAQEEDPMAPKPPEATAAPGTNGTRAERTSKDDKGLTADKPHKTGDKAGRRVLTGCACSIGDPLCSCL